MLFRYQSISLYSLQKRFLEVLSAVKAGSSLFDESRIVVQNYEMGRWLTRGEAAAAGISANNRFILPSKLMWELYRLKDDSVPHRLPADKIPMQWGLFKLFRRQPHLLREIEDANPEGNEAHLFRLCETLADVFDQYQMYRPDLIGLWNQGQLKYRLPEEKWQQKIWNELINMLPHNELPDRAEVINSLLKWITEGDYPFRELPGDLFVFGLSQLSQPESDVLAALANHLHVHLFEQIPANISKGTHWDEFRLRLTKPSTERDEVVRSSIQRYNTATKTESIEPEIEDDSFPGRLRKKIAGIPDVELRPDSGFCVHSCHSIKREAEVLKDALLSAMQSDEQLHPEDILVVVPDTGLYNPVLEQEFRSVFGGPELPLSAAGGKPDPVTVIFGQILENLTSAFKASEILSLLEHPVILSKLELGDNDVGILRRWTAELKIRHGVDGEVFSWRTGLNKLMLGYAMEADGYDNLLGYVPFTNLEGNELSKLASKYVSFVGILEKYSSTVKIGRSPVQWIELLKAMAEELLPDVAGNSPFRTSRLFNKLDDLKEYLQTSGFEEKVGYELFREWMLKQFDAAGAESGGFGHGITVSSYIPYRSIPYKFIAVLGFNEESFPRNEIKPEFDLLQKFPLQGDRNIKEDDRYIFYQWLMSAGQWLHFSYLGQSQTDNYNRMPSILLQQLSDHLQREGIPPKDILVNHRLHGFNKRYYGGESKSFSMLNARILNNLTNKQENPVPMFMHGLTAEEPEYIELDELLDYFGHPSKYIANNIIGVRSLAEEADISDRESFDLDDLEQYKVKSEIIEAAVNRDGLPVLQDYLQNKGVLPRKLPGKIIFNRLSESVIPLLKVYERYSGLQKQDFEAEIKLGDTPIYGFVSGIYNREYVHIQLSRRKEKHILRHWITHVFLMLAGAHIERSVLYSLESGKVKELEFKTIPNAGSYFSELIRQFLVGRTNPLAAPFLPESSRIIAESLKTEPDTYEQAKQKVIQDWEPGEYSKNTEGSDLYNWLIWRDSPPFESAAFKETAKAIWLPVLAAMDDGEQE